MVADLISLVPPWILLGVALGAVASALVALAFYLGDHFLGPGGPESDGRWESAGDERRRGEIREYLTAIDERFRENHAFDGVTVPFYLPDREVAITFDAHDYFQLEGEGIYTVLCEHEMPGRGLGRRLPFDVDEPDWGPSHGRSTGGLGPDPVAAAFAELDVARDADAGEVKRAYRERAKETHPDQGGDEEAFRRVREAYATAQNHASEGSPPGDRIDGTERSSPPTGFGR
ncbi:J domain-containing protein [Halorubrum sp. DTA46]|uniref:J domain-containing protein n=1 Tax=Halorubrum sp. DTA46 TaxID=3402162 RepID=UPI003AB0DB64